MGRRRRDKDRERGIAEERLERLADLAEAAARAGRLDRAARYGLLARRLGMRHQTPVPRRLGRRLCKECGAYLVPGVNSRVRVRGGRAVVTCLACGAVRRFGGKPGRSSRRLEPRP